MRSQLLHQIATMIPAAPGDDCVRVAIDGVDGVGKTTFADELASVIAGRPVLRISVDDFHHVRAIRYRRGRGSAEGFWLDSFDYDRLRADVLRPLGPGGSRRYRPKAHDLITDEVLAPSPLEATPGTVVIVDGLFLHRDELAGAWEFSVFLDAPFSATVARMAKRDGSHPDPAHESNARYVGAQRRYFAACAPHERANVVVDNSVLDAPRLVVTSVDHAADQR